MPTIAAQPLRPITFDPTRHRSVVIIDMQRDFVEPGGFGAALGNDVSLLTPAVAPNEKLLHAFRQLGLTVVHTKECHHADLSDCPRRKRSWRNDARIGDRGSMGRILVEGEPGNDFIAALQPRPGELVIPKPGKGAFYATPLQEELKKGNGVRACPITGVTTEVCVQTTMREANDRGYECLLVEDATERIRFPESAAATLEMVRAQGGIVGWTATSKRVLDALGAANRLNSYQPRSA